MGLLVGLALGMAGHALLDLTNTYGIALLAPISRQRVCFEWTFFLDLFTTSASALALAFVAPPLLKVFFKPTDEDRLAPQPATGHGHGHG